MWTTFATKAQKQLYMKFVCKFFKFSKSSKPNQPVLLIYELAWKTCSKLHVRLLLWPKLPTYFDDVTTIENNGQVCVNIDATLVAIFGIGENIHVYNIYYNNTQLSHLFHL